MISKNQIKHLRSLKQLKFRREYRQFVVEGPKMVDELLNSNIKVVAVYGVMDWVIETQEKHGSHKNIIERINGKELEQISNLTTPNQVVALCRIPEMDITEAEQDGVVLALDGIRDPGNLGTIIRTADWFGVKQIICSSDCVDAYNPKVIQSTMGSIARIKIFYTDLAEYLTGFTKNVYATVMDGTSIFNTQAGEGLYIIGNESNGIRPEVLRHATHLISIPEKGGAESLNAAVAAGITLSIATKK